MSDCKHITKERGCFCSNDGQKTSIFLHTEYGETLNGLRPVRVTPTTLDGTVINPNTYLGGGTPSIGSCNENRGFIDTCFLPDQYAIIWSWSATGALTSFDAVTGEVTYWGLTQIDGSPVGRYALAFKNDAVDPALYMQGQGQLYKADPSDPINTFTLVGSTSTATGSYPCFDFDPSGRLLLGDGKQVWETNPVTGESVYLGRLKDVRDGQDLNVSPGDWFFDPNGTWYMMARDNRGAQFLDADGNPYCTGTALWQIDTATLEATRVSPSCSPVSGTGASWLSASQYLLSTSAGEVYQYNKLTDEWSVLYNADDSGTDVTINDLASQWIIPDAIRVFGWVDANCNDANCTPTLFTLEQNEDNSFSCVEFIPTVPGKLGVCEPGPNPYVSDPFSPEGGGSAGCERCPDQTWHKGCSDAGETLWRISYDAAGNSLVEYIYGSLTESVFEQPSGFSYLECGSSNFVSDTTQWCNFDNVPPTGVFRKEYSDGTIVWFDESGTIEEPANKIAGECPIEDQDPLLPVTEQIVCIEGETYVRLLKEVYTEDPDGSPELSEYQIVYYNEDGTLYDSGILTSTETPVGEPEYSNLGNCISPFIDFRIEKLCEIDDEKLLLVDSFGAFAEYSFTDGSLTDISTLQVPSAGSGADPDNFILYAVTSAQTLQTVDVNTKVTISDVPLFSNDGSPTTFSAAHFYDGWLYTYDYVADNVHRINVNTAEVSFYSGPWTDITGSGASLAINPVDGRFYVTGSGGRVYEIDSAAGSSGPASLVYTSPGGTANGATFDTSGNLYLTGGPNTYQIVNFGTGAEIETNIINDWGPGANSITYYRTRAQEPSCFFRKYGVLEDGSLEYLSDHFVSDFSNRVVSGAITCCGSTTSGSTGGSVTILNDPNETLCDGSTGYFTESVKTPFTYYELTNVTGTLRRRDWSDVFGDQSSYPASERTISNALSFIESFDTGQTPTSEEYTYSTLSTNDIDSTGAVTDYQLIEGYITTSDPVKLRWTGGSEGYTRISLGRCCGPLETVQSYIHPPTKTDAIVDIEPGVHEIRLDNLDMGGTNSNQIVQYSIDGGLTWRSGFSSVQLSTSKPFWQLRDGYICNGEYYSLDGTLLDLSSETLSREKPSCFPSSSCCSDSNISYATGFDTQVFNGSLQTPNFPDDTKQVVVMNTSNAIITIETSVGSQTVGPNGTIEFSVDDKENELTATSISLINGSFTNNDSLIFNYKTRF